MRNFLTTLFLSQGVPMLLGGDELARTQHGNNNAYCQDNEISWFDWELDERQERLLEFTRRLIHFRRRPPGLPADAVPDAATRRSGSGLPDSWWFRPDGRKMTRRDWGDGELRAIGLFLNGDEIPARTPRRASHVIDDSFLLLFNAHHEPVDVPAAAAAVRRALEARALDRRRRTSARASADVRPRGARSTVEPRSIVLLRRGWYVADFRATYRLQLGPHLDFRGARRARARTCASSGVTPPLPLAVAPGARGLDARLRRRRPDARSPRSSAARTSSARSATRRAARGRARHRPEPHGGERARTRSGATRCCARSSSTSTGATGWHRRFFDIDELAGVRVEDPEVFEATHAKVLELVARRARRRPARSTTRTGSPTRAVPRAAARARASSTSGSRRSSSRASSSRDWPVEGTTGLRVR